jgi:hypothetical protein
MKDIKKKQYILSLIKTSIFTAGIIFFWLYVFVFNRGAINSMDFLEIKQRIITNAPTIIIIIFIVPLSFLIAFIFYRKGRNNEKAEWIEKQSEKLKIIILEYQNQKAFFKTKEKYYQNMIDKKDVEIIQYKKMLKAVRAASAGFTEGGKS